LKLTEYFMELYNLEAISSAQTLSSPAALDHYHRANAILEQFAETYSVGDYFGGPLVDQAIQEINDGIQLDPNYPGFYIFLGSIDLGKFDKQGAYNHLSKAIELDPAFSDEYCMPGQAQALRGISQCLFSFKKEDWENGLVDFHAAMDLGFEGIESWVAEAKSVIQQLEQLEQLVEQLKAQGHSTDEINEIIAGLLPQ
jgi:tetratricopeptide (TPR) repeat protein